MYGLICYRDILEIIHLYYYLYIFLECNMIKTLTLIFCNIVILFCKSIIIYQIIIIFIDSIKCK